jgi:serine/arginine repetitive matrix protein 2
MRTTISTLSHPTVTTTPPASSTSTNIPTIRLITATPSAAGDSTTNSPGSFFANTSPDSSTPTPLLPKHERSPKKRLVPKKKSKLSLLTGVGRDKDKEKGKDLSDVLRRVGVSPADSASARGFEIYVDPADDPEIGEIVVVKKKKSRTALESVHWGTGALGDVTNMTTATTANVDAVPAKDVIKAKGEEKGEGKWWTIGRGRKDSKEKDKTGKSTLTATFRASCKFRSFFCI